MMTKDVDVSKRANEIIENQRMNPQRIIIIKSIYRVEELR